MTYQEELDARYEAWQREQTLASLDDCGIILPMDTSSAAWRRDYGVRNTSSGRARTNPDGLQPTADNNANTLQGGHNERGYGASLPDSKSDVGCITGLVNVMKFYACCALIVGAVYVAVKVVAK